MSAREITTLIPIYIIVFVCALRYVYLDLDDVDFAQPSLTYGGYCVRPREFSGNAGEHERVALILHVSADFVSDKFDDQVSNWNAPISLAVYLDDPAHQVNCMMEFFGSLYNRSDVAQKYLTVHYVYKQIDGDCEIRARACRGLKEDVPYPIQAEYPANLLRNVARLHHSSKYILIGDFDHLFSRGFEKRMLELANRLDITRNKQALVYRLFEIEEGEEDPQTKTQLSKLVDEGKAITFHAEFIMPDPELSRRVNPHYIEGEREWLRRQENATVSGVAGSLKYDNPKWEPQFVSSSFIPMHDELFPYRIRDNTCLRWEMCRAGYKWMLVEDLFMFHRGIKRFGSSSKSESTKIQRLNIPRFHEAIVAFESRLDEEYPLTKKTCPVCRYEIGLAC